MDHQTGTPDTTDGLDLAWTLLLDQRNRMHSGSLSAEPADISNEITTSQLGKLFQEAGERTRDLIDLYAPLNAELKDGYVVAHLGQSLDGRIAARQQRRQERADQVNPRGRGVALRIASEELPDLRSREAL
ncbi:MAG: hypothetical protein HC871_13290, partial [Rhizobiales bacterium]|nr:hypothetical protein [Hyphomicrobiales bacterium]